MLIFEQIIEHSTNAIFLVDGNLHLSFANRHGEILFHRLIRNGQLEAALTGDQQVLDINDQNKPRFIRSHCVISDGPGKPPHHLFIGTDISAELLAQREEFHLRRRLEQTLEITEEGFWLWNIADGEVSHNHFFSRIFGLQDGALQHHERDITCLIHPEDIGRFSSTLQQHLRGETAMFNCEYRLLNAQQQQLWVQNHGKVVRHDDSGKPVEMLGKVKDITEKKQREQEMHNLAWHDPLTQLDNRPRFYDKLEQARQQSIDSGEYLALLYLDLNRFKEVNDALGHGAGDTLLKEVALRLRNTVRSDDALARLGGDEFALLIGNLGTSLQQAKTRMSILVDRLLENISRDMALDNTVVNVTTSMGIYLFNQDRSPVAELLHKADMAQYFSKKNQRKWMFWSPQLHEEQSQRDAIETGLRRALDNGEFYLEYQPQYSRGGEATSLEALLRWQTPDGRIISPSTFIPIAENSGLILNISEWVLEQTCAQLRNWQNQPQLDKLGVAVNISPRQLKRADFLKTVERIVLQSGIDASQLSFELSENALTENLPDTQRKLSALREMNINIAVDNFGTGMASLTGLRKLAITEVKIDRSFVLQMAQNSDFMLTIRGIVAMCQALNINIVAEGVENSQQFSTLSEMGCHRFQGWLFSRSLAPELLHAVLQHRQR
ncbi:diguanylate cyclase (GGDEF)-like protein/PAS domain S-box-containing protein [Erwinia toletana]|uniref:Diguanylate cyclase (GGDEF)-like protein/PAS domain S-box-containing protein n=1 Tax=Winslowiella toletana TaxID=92490 RepID=A0ABS4PE41_9GAMM|nr:EAL domain-containing protein [Winslowiella toletana]MBP2170901.1 diguanylate cyclase (GGDEF)-like protein/PAS domain S-box-containing protein [Winslowiella toletana]